MTHSDTASTTILKNNNSISGGHLKGSGGDGDNSITTFKQNRT